MRFFRNVEKVVVRALFGTHYVVVERRKEFVAEHKKRQLLGCL